MKNIDYIFLKDHTITEDDLSDNNKFKKADEFLINFNLDNI
jgi:hypothetical protein